MRNTTKRARASVAVLLALFLSLGAAACGSSDDDNTEGRGEGGGAIVSNPKNGSVTLKGHAGIVDAGQRELFEELTTYPFGAHDDLADATAAAVEHLLSRPAPRVWV